MDDLLGRAEGYLRTARAALANGDLPQAYENARTAAELAAKQMLARAGVHTGKEHNVAPALFQAKLWPPGERAKRLSKLLQDHTRGVYGFAEPIHRREVERAILLAGLVIAAAAPPKD